MSEERFISPGSPLNVREREILALLIEECAEVQQRATKALRFGLDETQPGQPHSNSTRLAHEVGDLEEVIAMAEREGLLFSHAIRDGRIGKKAQLARYMQTKATGGTP